MSCVMYVICNLSCPSSSLLLMHKSWPNGSAAWGLMFVGTLASANTGATHWQDHDDDDGDDGGVYDDDNCESIVMFLGTLASATTLGLLIGKIMMMMMMKMMMMIVVVVVMMMMVRVL